MAIKKPIVLIILDGWGISSPSPGNAITSAKTPNIKSYLNSYPHTELISSGEAVGLPRGEPGNSEAGHLNIGAGTIVYQELPRINMAIADGSFFQNYALLSAIKQTKEKNSKLHLIGLVGSGGVHSNIEHLFALLRLAHEHNVADLFLHLFTDGRDSPPKSTVEYLKLIENKIHEYKVGKIATIMGRFYGMDRDNRWDRIKVAYEAMTEGKGMLTSSWEQAITGSYDAGKSDEFIEPLIMAEANKPVCLIDNNDAVIFFNFRIDRPRELTKAFVEPNFERLILAKRAFDPYAERYGKKQYEDVGALTTFRRNKVLKDLLFVTMTEYETGLPVLVAFPPEPVINPLAMVLAENQWRQFHIAETEKERHVTYYFDGKREDSLPGEDRLEIPSPKEIKTYDQKPEMSAYQVTETLINRLKLKIYDFIVVNYANPDMVGHTGVLQAAIKACEVTDECVSKVVKTTLSLGGVCFIISDHGNAEVMINKDTNEPDTEHNANPVPFIYIGDHSNSYPLNLSSGILADVAVTILKVANIPKPSSMTGRSLL